jgi:hypothetical protein
MEATLTPADQATALVSIKAHIEAIRDHLKGIKDAIEQIAKEFAAISSAVGGDDKAIDALHDEMPGIGLAFWRNIALVSSGKLHPLVISSGASAVKTLAALPIAEQQRAVTVGVPVATGSGDHRLVPAHLLTAREIKLAIDPLGRIRSIAEQGQHVKEMKCQEEEARRKYLESIKCAPAEEPDDQSEVIRWRVTGKGRAVLVQCPVTLTESDILKILKDMRRGN